MKSCTPPTGLQRDQIANGPDYQWIGAKDIRKQRSLILSEQQRHQPREAPQQCAPRRRQAGRLSAGSGAQAGPGRVGKLPRSVGRTGRVLKAVAGEVESAAD